MAEAPAQSVQVEIGTDKQKVWIEFRTEGVPPIRIHVDPQAGFEMGEKLARAAHMVRFGKAPPSDVSYLHEQIKSMCTEQMRHLLVNRLNVMLSSTREDRAYTNIRLAQVLVDTILTKVS